MKLLECYIENFGKLSGFSYSFTQGMNVFCQENGWGKTTFAAFLKAMLYGLPATRSKNLFENERARYIPWQGGRFGGWLTFEVGGKVYRVERSFGKKEAEDTYLLLDGATHIPSKDFGEGILGEVLFGIDLKGFERSTYISEKSEYVEADYSDVQAKLVNLQDFADVDKAIKRLNERKKFYRPASTRGEILDLTNLEYQLKDELTQAEKAAKEHGRLEEQVSLLENRQKALLEESEKLRQAIDKIAKGRLIETYAQHAKELENAAKAAEKELQDILRSPIPSFEELAEVTRATKHLEDKPAPVPPAVTSKRKASPWALMLGILGVLFGGLGLVKAWLYFPAAVLLLAGVGLALIKKDGRKTKAEEPKEQVDAVSEDKATIEAFLAKYPGENISSESAEEVLSRVSQLIERRERMIATEQKAKLAREAATQYRESHPLPIERDRLPGEAEEQALHQKVEECQKELRETVSRLQDLQRENAGYATLAGRLPDIRQKLADVTEALAVAKENYRVVMATMAYLEEAKAQLTASYLDQVQEKFAYYVGQMSRIDPALATDRFKLTPSFEVTVVESGASHAESSVSRGTRDLLALCLRLALRDAIFDKEEPPLLLDDPFIAFDEERIGAALACLKDMAKTKQMIYFTCHESRI